MKTRAEVQQKLIMHLHNDLPDKLKAPLIDDIKILQKGENSRFELRVGADKKDLSNWWKHAIFILVTPSNNNYILQIESKFERWPKDTAHYEKDHEASIEKTKLLIENAIKETFVTPSKTDCEIRTVDKFVLKITSVITIDNDITEVKNLNKITNLLANIAAVVFNLSQKLSSEAASVPENSEDQEEAKTINHDYVTDWNLDNDQVLVVAGDWAFNIAEKYGIYECQNKRTFRPSKYMAFYKNSQIDTVFEIIEKPYDNGTGNNTPAMASMKKDMPDYDDKIPRRVIKLKKLQKVGPIINDGKSKTGKTVPFTYGQPRYTTFELITKAKVTSELVHGLNANIIIDTFINNKSKQSPKVDILWVIDNSGSMGTYQNSLANNFDSFIQEFIDKPAIEIPDFKMAITTTDENNNGKISDGDGYLCKERAIDEDDEHLFLASFILDIKVGTSGSANEKGLKCAWLALKNNPSFFRHDAPLVINIVTDEEDDDNIPVDEYLSNLKIKKNGQRVVINLIGLPGFKRYQHAVNKTNGVYLDIKSDFSNVLKNISLQMVEVTKSFPLSHQPINPSSIKVRSVDKLTTDFIYSASTNSIKPGTSIPVDAIIEVEYEIED
jgi:hypothetical protein